MSLKVKCFATAIQESIKKSVYNIEIHSNLFNLAPVDFASLVCGLEKESGSYSINIMIGENESSREVPLEVSPIFTKFAYKIKDTTPVPLINQPLSIAKNEYDEFRCSRFWAFDKYFFVINRKYSENEILEIKMRIHFIVRKFKSEMLLISSELEDIDL